MASLLQVACRTVLRHGRSQHAPLRLSTFNYIIFTYLFMFLHGWKIPVLLCTRIVSSIFSMLKLFCLLAMQCRFGQQRFGPITHSSVHLWPHRVQSDLGRLLFLWPCWLASTGRQHYQFCKNIFYTSFPHICTPFTFCLLISFISLLLVHFLLPYIP